MVSAESEEVKRRREILRRCFGDLTSAFFEKYPDSARRPQIIVGLDHGIVRVYHVGDGVLTPVPEHLVSVIGSAGGTECVEQDGNDTMRNQ